MIYHLNEPPYEVVDDPNMLLERVRIIRNRLLTACDWSMLSDAPTDKQAWETYRQALRDFPATWTPGPTAEFPDPPA